MTVLPLTKLLVPIVRLMSRSCWISHASALMAASMVVHDNNRATDCRYFQLQGMPHAIWTDCLAYS